jgi:hypothetical protein
VKPVEISFGERYEDDSGWRRMLKVRDRGDYGVTISLVGAELSCGMADLRWLIGVADEALAQMESE